MTWTPIVDGHADTLARLAAENRSLGGCSTRGHSDLGRLLRAGVALQVLAICTEPEEAGLVRVLELIDRCQQDLAGRADAKVVLRRGDLDWLGPGRVGFLLALEGAGPLAGRPGLLRPLHQLGLRLVGLTWNGRNQFADGVAVEGGGGLTGAGRELVALAEELGVVVDLAHLHPKGFWDVLSIARRPVVVSHANARAVRDHPRNLDDDQLRALADRGGLVGINLCPPFLTAGPAATVEDVLRHLEHLLSVAGPAAVGFGFDFDGIDDTPEGLAGIEALPTLLGALDALGLSADERESLLGGNWLRVLRQILP